MKLYDKIKLQLDFNNSYSVDRTMKILNGELTLAINNKDLTYAREIFRITKDIYKIFSSTYRESADYGATMSYVQMAQAKKMRNLIDNMSNDINTTFNLPSIREIVNEM